MKLKEQKNESFTLGAYVAPQVELFDCRVPMSLLQSVSLDATLEDFEDVEEEF